MDNSNTVFMTIKKLCGTQSKMAEINSLKTVAVQSRVPEMRLPIYLSHLENLGLIKYSLEDQYIYLTPLGNSKQSLE